MAALINKPPKQLIYANLPPHKTCPRDNSMSAFEYVQWASIATNGKNWVVNIIYAAGGKRV